MKQDDLNGFKRWFRAHIADVCRELPGQDLGAIFLKEQHTHRVMKDILLIARTIDGISEQDMSLAETIALFHDVGRFVQWRDYKTFVDSESKDHALIGLDVLSRSGTLDNIDPIDRKIVEDAIRHHNGKDLPEGLDARTMLFVKLIRDADKLDIWHVVTTYRPGESAVLDQVIIGDVPATSSFSKPILDSLMRGDKSDIRFAKTQNDYRLLRLGWIFDLNFKASFREVLKRMYVEKIIAQLPDIPEMRALKELLLDRLTRLAGS